MKFGVVVFPGSNCDHDAYHAARHVLGQEAEFLWHKDRGLKGADVIVLPGGFAHGDYLRTGAIARFSPIMPAIQEFARGGGLRALAATTKSLFAIRDWYIRSFGGLWSGFGRGPDRTA